MDSFQSRLKSLIDESGYSNSKIASSIKVGRSTITGWLKGDYEPNSENIFRLAKLFNVSEEWLMGLVEDRERKVRIVDSIDRPLHLPLLLVSAGKLEQDTSQDEETVECPTSLKHYGDNLFAIKVSGESMNKILPNGSIIICLRASEMPQSGDIVVFKNGSGICVKRFIETESLLIFEPVSYSTAFETLTFKKQDQPDIEIIGIVKFNCQTFE